MEENFFIKQSQEIINNVFKNSFFDPNLFHELMYGKKAVNYDFLCTYLDCLKDNMEKTIPSLSYKEMIDDFIPAYRESIKNLPGSYVLFSIMNFHHAYDKAFKDFRESENYKEIVSCLTSVDTPLSYEYKKSISIYFSEYYKLPKNKINP